MIVWHRLPTRVLSTLLPVGFLLFAVVQSVHGDPVSALRLDRNSKLLLAERRVWAKIDFGLEIKRGQRFVGW